MSLKSNLFFSLLGLMTVMSVGCGGDRLRLGAKLKGASTLFNQRQLAFMQGHDFHAMDVNFKGIYFGELEIVAYDYRPGQSVQSDDFGNGSDWSYWVALQNGTDVGRDNVLRPGDELDFADFSGGYSSPLDEDFVSEVGSFEVDFFEVNLYRTGIVYGTGYYGMNAELNGLEKHPLHKYPEWSSYADSYGVPVFPGSTFDVNGQSVSVLFARSDWFPDPVLIQMQSGDPNQIQTSSAVLTTTQEDLIESLVSQGTQRRFYDRLIVIPFSGPHVFDLSSSPIVSVDFDLSDPLDAATDLMADPPEVVYKGDVNHVPFGLTVTFGE